MSAAHPAAAQAAQAADAAANADATTAAVTIVGGGPIGLTCALMLAHHGVGVQVIEARPAGEPRASDRRLLALSRGTLEMLAKLGLQQLPTAPIRQVHVSSAGQFGAVQLDAADLGGTLLGATIYHADLHAALVERIGVAAPQGRIDLLQPRRVTSLAQRPHEVELTLDDGRRVRSRVVVSADGISAALPGMDGSHIRPGPGGVAETRAAQAHLPTDVALCAEILVRGPQRGSAFERFTRDGPLALLPLPDSQGQRPRPDDSTRPMALIWCMGRTAAERRQTLDDAAFAVELAGALGPRLGRVVAIGVRSAVPLRQQLRASVRERRVVFLGNAAQALHPVMGQGFNLGVRDCATLADCIAADRWRAAGARGTVDELDPAGASFRGDPVAALARYVQRRRVDRRVISALTGSPGHARDRAAAAPRTRAAAGLRRTHLATPQDARTTIARLARR
jgi:2-octaprenyl-6-methoxyphenol hydroxylase